MNYIFNRVLNSYSMNSLGSSSQIADPLWNNINIVAFYTRSVNVKFPLEIHTPCMRGYCNVLHRVCGIQMEQPYSTKVQQVVTFLPNKAQNS